ncbi:hypothetical protein DRF75_04865 [Ehrlichia minasensis]|uniref:Uncharacterized protein n=1 Tax=Ehrlichia minasensis TaxID=1242993 RepID=A0A4Q6I397_9RICK|nr:hypothetical protein [Ehrlichia minasensis]RZB12302.1 hypothetical protein DRF75_04865 [Ehrlichia minasensis]
MFHAISNPEQNTGLSSTHNAGTPIESDSSDDDMNPSSNVDLQASPDLPEDLQPLTRSRHKR